MSDWLLTYEEIREITYEYRPDMVNFSEPNAVAKAQAKKLVQWLEDNHRQFMVDRQTGEVHAQGISLYEGHWQALKREVEA